MKYQFFSLILLLALLASACHKDNGSAGNKGVFEIFAEKMTSENGSKLLFFPDSINNAEWIASELINFNGSAFPIEGNRSDGFSIDLGSSIPDNLFAIYPATVNDALGNCILVTNGGDSGPCAIDIHSLAVNFHTSNGSSSAPLNGSHDVFFPMAATASSSDNGIFFDHLTGGIRLTLRCTSSDVSVSRLVIHATKEDYSPSIYRDIAPDWASGGLLPSIPIGHGSSEDQPIELISDMTLMLNTEGQPGVTISSSGISFCVPMLALSLKNLEVVGFSGSNPNPVFIRSKSFDSPKNIERNKMYNIPTININ